MLKQELFKKYLIFLFGLFINSLGVAFITKADLGTSPISSIPYTLSLGFKPTIGQYTIIFSLFLIVIQIILLKGLKCSIFLPNPLFFKKQPLISLIFHKKMNVNFFHKKQM